MISKVEAVARLKKMGVMVADDYSIVTILIPSEVSFATGLKDVRSKLADIGYEASFCVKQTGEKLSEGDKKNVSASLEEAADVHSEEENISDEELNSYMAVDDDGQFTLDLGF